MNGSYCAPEEFVNEEHPYAFDMYGAAITWMRTVLSGDGSFEGSSGDNNGNGEAKSSLGLGDEDNLFRWRMDVRNFGHNLAAWEEYATLHNSLPHGWDDLFGSSRRGIHALRLLSNMMSYSPGCRMSAAEALVGPYLNPDCEAEPPPDLPPAMPYSIMSHIQRWKKDKEVHGGECQLEDLFTRVVAVELDWPVSGLLFGPNNDKRTKQQSERKVGGGGAGGGGGVSVKNIIVGDGTASSTQLG
jgi:serine/threonine protein kinase